MTPARLDALLLVGPLAPLERPSLGAHRVQACARSAGYAVEVAYPNLAFARRIGAGSYEALSIPLTPLLGERLFATAAYGLPPLGRRRGPAPPAYQGGWAIDWAALEALVPETIAWADDVAAEVARRDVAVVACSATFHQLSASVALLERIKRRRPDVLTAIGGAHCDGPMADGVASLTPAIDVVFSGEAEWAFTELLAHVRAGRRPPRRIVRAAPARDLDALPTPDYGEFYAATDLPDAKLVLPYQSSRGCWWGQRHHCTFCGLNGNGMAFRAKSADRVIEELRALLAAHPNRKVQMADNIMHRAYFRTLLPRLPAEVGPLQAFWEQKARMTLEQLETLAAAGVDAIEAGLEALDDAQLARIDKGTTVAQNVRLLRHGRAAGMRRVCWNLLCQVPGDRREEWEATLALLPLLRHLDPPVSMPPISLDRFSPYVERPADHGITDLRPHSVYVDAFPAHADLYRLAYHFEGDYPSASREDPTLLERAWGEIEAWQAARRRGAALAVGPTPPALAGLGRPWVLSDRRELPGREPVQLLTDAHARLALAGPTADTDPALRRWGIEQQVLAEVSGELIPLATASAEVLRRFEREVPLLAAST